MASALASSVVDGGLESAPVKSKAMKLVFDDSPLKI